jgi:hypothetical protein
MSNLIELSGRFVSNGEQVPFQVEIRMPQQDGPFGDYLCRVLSPQLFSRCMDVYGVSRNQAVRLAVNLIKEALTSLVVTDEEIDNDVGGQTGQGEGKGG